ncbi:Zn(II)2Cys6 transcription factor domain-containing protein [Aspergillus saccharolyticus JOP 1030-1]|uniref:Zn(2)-C6 fungal-type domain-containing protein n=1 Tax=Aspergillus saccharolyticus JOP 1030-1 TaxID=1450539 RepID=A0A318ZDI5_9EURO|nr:hypothetical protein BP01DRAFT_382590 [Aspergillus saccharolyticus JOP 1030-1]PYH45571.1 hypothetical protein BP01DRAFT_382590 [Aspergillus saccharolyticus JOP 1030-1]
MVGVAGQSKGCNTCRARKIACDQQRPECARCTRSPRACGGYERDRVFVRVQPAAQRKHIYLKAFSASPSQARSEISPSLTIPGCRPCNLYDGMLPESAMLPADAAVGPLPALGHRRDYLSMAKKVGQSIEYLMQDELMLAGPLSVTPTLGIVIDSLRDQPHHRPVVAWLRAAMGLVPDRGG